MLIRIYRHPDAPVASGGAAVASAPETAAAKGAPAPASAAETPSQTTPDAQAAGKGAEAKPPLTDWQQYQKMNEKFERNPNARPTKAEMALQAKYAGKDESAIDGFAPQDHSTPAKKPAADDPKPGEKPEAKAEGDVKPGTLPKELESLVGEKSPIGAKTLADVAPKIQGLVGEIKKLNGQFGAVDRFMTESGFKNLPEAKSFVQNAAKLHRLVEDIKAGKPEALAYIGQRGGPPARQPTRGGEPPEGVLDHGLYNHFAPEVQSLKQELAGMKKLLDERHVDVDAWKKAEQKRVAGDTRKQQVNDIVTEVGTLVQGASHLWDAKKHGSLNQALTEYYESPEGGDFNPGLKTILEVLDIAREKRIEDLEIAYSHWERKNRGNQTLRAREEARQPFLGKQPTAGLSDLQGQHSGQFTEFTKSQVQNMGRPGYPKVPSEWKDSTGTLIPTQIPAYARAWLFPDQYPEE